VLPAPFGPMTPTMPPGGSEKLSSSNRSRSPKALLTPSASTTSEPRRGPGGMTISNSRSFSAVLSFSIASYALMRAWPFACRALVRQLLYPGALVRLLGPGGRAAPPREPVRPIEPENAPRDVDEKVAVMRRRDDGAVVPALVLREPVHALRIKVIRRLEQHED